MRVLIAVSGSNDGSSDPVSAAASFPWPKETEFCVVTVAESVSPPVVQLLDAARDTSELQHAVDNIAASVAASAVGQLRELGFPADGASPEGDAASMIVQHAREWGADLIVVGSCDKSRLETLFVGSVSRSVVDHAPCSVLVAKTKAREE